MVAAVCGGLIFGIAYVKVRRVATAEALLARFPAEDGMILAIDLESLRRTGILAAFAGNKVAQEPEYRAFVGGTGFDYQQDLDLALAWFRQGNTYLLLRGRFDWPRLRDYVAMQGGVCRNVFCRLEGSTPQRKISFFPLSGNVMALAVSPDAWAASALAERRPAPPGTSYPSQPFWLLVPASMLHDAGSLPAGVRPFSKAMSGAEKVVFSLAPAGGRLEVQVDVTCRSGQEAGVLASQLEGVTSLLNAMTARQATKPDPKDLGGVLAAGRFEQVDQRVLGRWPIERSFLEAILEGSQ